MNSTSVVSIMRWSTDGGKKSPAGGPKPYNLRVGKRHDLIFSFSGGFGDTILLLTFSSNQ